MDSRSHCCFYCQIFWALTCRKHPGMCSHRFGFRGLCVIALFHTCMCLLTAHAMRLCEDPGGRQQGLGSFLSLQPTRKMAPAEDACQTAGNKRVVNVYLCTCLLCCQNHQPRRGFTLTQLTFRNSYTNSVQRKS